LIPHCVPREQDCHDTRNEDAVEGAGAADGRHGMNPNAKQATICALSDWAARARRANVHDKRSID